MVGGFSALRVGALLSLVSPKVSDSWELWLLSICKITSPPGSMRSGRGTDGIRLLHFYLAGNKLHTWKIYISVVTLFTFSFINLLGIFPQENKR